MMWLLYLFVSLAALALLLLWLIQPNKRRDMAPFNRTLYAHRGLHSDDSRVPENSIAAFAAASKAGYGVELDIQLSLDRQIVVFHDDNLKRMCGVDRRVDELTYDELRELRLLNSDQPIPLLSEVLEVLDGATVLCELKPMRSYTDTSLCEAALPLLNAYNGIVCIESFNPWMVRWFRKHAPQYVRGILSKRFDKGEVAQTLRFPLASLFANCLCRPDFIAYQHTDHRQPFFRLCRLFRPMTMAWTVKSPAEQTSTMGIFDTIIFEGFSPTDTE